MDTTELPTALNTDLYTLTRLRLSAYMAQPHLLIRNSDYPSPIIRLALRGTFKDLFGVDHVL